MHITTHPLQIMAPCRIARSPGTGRKHAKSGFALAVSVMLMVLLTALALCLLSLGSITLRSSSRIADKEQARSNARMAVILAIGELQKQTGDDRRITADASITGKSAQSHVVGVWSSWSPDFAASPLQSPPDYAGEKKRHFLTWLASAPDPAKLRNPDWVRDKPGSDWIPLFTAANDGFDLSAPPVNLPGGRMAWIISQEATKAKLNVAGQPAETITDNAALHAQVRPSPALAANLRDPDDADWNLRASRLLSFKQLRLDIALVRQPESSAQLGDAFGVHAMGLLTDVVRGGFKTDMNLGFEMQDDDFAKNAWDGVPNPFRASGSMAGFDAPAPYAGEQPLFRPLLENPIISHTTNFGSIAAANRFYAAAVPTFHHLRSYYRIPRHLYGGSGPPIVADRGPNHVAVMIPPAGANEQFAPANPPPGGLSQLAIRPVLNRVIFLLSAMIGPDGQLRLVITPVICLWNPYHVALETEGTVVYPWMDFPFEIKWHIKSKPADGGQTINRDFMLGSISTVVGKGRQIDPYFFCELTAGGVGATDPPIHFDPGEIRIFVPASTIPQPFDYRLSNARRTVRMRPVTGLADMNTRGGLAIPMRGGFEGTGFDYAVATTDTVSTELRALNNEFHYFVAMEDSARIKNRSDRTRGQVISDVQMLNFVSAVDKVVSPEHTYQELRDGTVPFGVLETIHHVAKSGSSAGQAVADLVYTTNPRQINITHLLAAGSFTNPPHYQSTLRAVASFDGAIQTPDGRRAFWGPSQTASGRDVLPFFEIPRQPLLSLAAFQQADLASSTFASASQFANSWASPYLGRNRVAMIDKDFIQTGVPIYDTSYLTNESLWDGFFFSGAAPRLTPAAASTPGQAWNGDIAGEDRSVNDRLTDFVADPLRKPLANPRMRLLRRNYSDTELVKRLGEPAGCTRIASHLLVDGAFNINSTHADAWASILAGLRGQSMQVDENPVSSGQSTAFPRARYPTGKANDNWNGYRTLSDEDIRSLAQKIVAEVIARGPFLSLAEFVNRQVGASDLGRCGAIQSAIETLKLNAGASQAAFDTTPYPPEARNDLFADTGVGIPGWLTQADVLQSIAPVLAPRSDTFTIRGYGEVRDAQGRIRSRVWSEAVVQRFPDFVDPRDPPETSLNQVSNVNARFGRRYKVISFRELPENEL